MVVESAEVLRDFPDAATLRRDFPALTQSVHGHPLAYLDNAATTQKPEAVIRAEGEYYRRDNANVHRGVHTLSERATAEFEAARAAVARFIGAAEADEIVFTRGTTEAINLAANAWGGANLGAGDEILITELEHHSNIVPWQLIAARSGAKLVVAPIDEDGNVPLEDFSERLNSRTRIAAFGHVSNALGSVNPVAEMTRLAHAAGALVLVDGAQAVGHLPVDVGGIDCDFYAFSGHKMYATMGIGGLYIRAGIAADMPPWQGGGEMIRSVSFENTLYAEPPHRFEAGTPNVAGAVGLKAAIAYLDNLGMARLAAGEDETLEYALEQLRSVQGLNLVGRPAERVGAISFTIDGIHPHDLGTLLDHAGVAIRTGHHCAQPVMEHYHIPATARASLGLYSTTGEIDQLVAALNEARKVFSP
ncbi:MAG: cysteine desulfurase [Gammaproteobacteria bacterium]|nr:cysteine desulfurase [Gammaproteobacteria bacterium]